MTHAAIDQALADAYQRFTDANPASLRQFEAQARYMPGANSRSVLFYAPTATAIPTSSPSTRPASMATPRRKSARPSSRPCKAASTSRGTTCSKAGWPG